MCYRRISRTGWGFYMRRASSTTMDSCTPTSQPAGIRDPRRVRITATRSKDACTHQIKAVARCVTTVLSVLKSSASRRAAHLYWTVLALEERCNAAHQSTVLTDPSRNITDTPLPLACVRRAWRTANQRTRCVHALAPENTRWLFVGCCVVQEVSWQNGHIVMITTHDRARSSCPP